MKEFYNLGKTEPHTLSHLSHTVHPPHPQHSLTAMWTILFLASRLKGTHLDRATFSLEIVFLSKSSDRKTAVLKKSTWLYPASLPPKSMAILGGKPYCPLCSTQHMPLPPRSSI